MNEPYISIITGVVVFLAAFLLQLIFAYIPERLKLRRLRRKGNLMRIRVVEIKGPRDNVLLICEDNNNKTYKVHTDTSKEKLGNITSGSRVHAAVIGKRGIMLQADEYLNMLEENPKRDCTRS